MIDSSDYRTSSSAQDTGGDVTAKPPYGGSLDGYDRVKPFTMIGGSDNPDAVDEILSTLTPDPAAQAKYMTGVPEYYEEFSPFHHPTFPAHFAAWHLSLFEVDPRRGVPIYVGSDPARSAGLGLLGDDFISYFSRKMELINWSNPDGSPIKNALKFTLDEFDAWRRGQLAKPHAERVCAFGEDGFPADLGTYSDCLWAAWVPFLWSIDDGTHFCPPPPRAFENLAIRGLVPHFTSDAFEEFRKQRLDELQGRAGAFSSALCVDVTATSPKRDESYVDDVGCPDGLDLSF